MKKIYLLALGMWMGFHSVLMADDRTELDAAEWTDASHNFQGEHYAAATNGSTWVNTLADEGAWFSYDLSLDDADVDKPLYLACRFYNGDYNGRETVIYADEMVVSRQMPKPVQYTANAFSEAYVFLPALCWKNEDGTSKSKITIKVMSKVGDRNYYSFGFYRVALVQGADYAFKCTDWTTGDTGRLPEGNITYTEDNTLRIVSSGNNNVALSMKSETDGLYAVSASRKYLVVCGTNLKTDAGCSYLWWLNGRNASTSEVPIYQATMEDGTSYVVWNVMETAVSGNVKGTPFTLTSYGGSVNTIFGLTSSTGEEKPVEITDIGFYSLVGIADKYPELAAEMGVAALDEMQTDATVALAEGGKVGMKRVLKPFVWNTLCVPFDMDANLIEAHGITAVKELAGAERDDAVTFLTFEDAAQIKAGHPYIVKVNNILTEINVDAAADVQPSPVEQADVNGVKMVGNYGNMNINGEGLFFINSNMFYQADTDVTVKGFRAYIDVSLSSPVSQVNRMLIRIDGEATSVDDVLGSGVFGNEFVDVYALSGICMKKRVRVSEALDGFPKGIYVVNGKKCMKW